MVSQPCRLLGCFFSDRDKKSIELILQDVGIPCILRTLARYFGKSLTYGFPHGASITLIGNNLLCEVLGAIPREARCIKRHTIILVWKLVRSYPKLKVDIAPRKFSRLLLPQITDIGVIVNSICPFFCRVPHHLPILHKCWSFCRKFRSVYSNKYLESRSLGVNSANAFVLLKWFKTQCRLTRGVFRGVD